jgi:hypothetical protein
MSARNSSRKLLRKKRRDWPGRISVGDKRDRLTVLDISADGIVRCGCSCGGEISVPRHKLHKPKFRRSCGCLIGESLRTGVGDLSGSYWSTLRQNANRRGHRIGITIRQAWLLFLRQRRRCALSGVILKMTLDRVDNTASLDRIDSRRGYVRGNVQWIHQDINLMKNVLPQERFLELCRTITVHQENTCEQSSLRRVV